MTFKNLCYTDTIYYEDVNSMKERAFIVEEIYDILLDAYKNVPGGLLFSSHDDLLYSTSLWKLVYFQEKIVGVIVYKAKRGLKMVALGISALLQKNIQQAVKQIFSSIFKMTYRATWMEVSEGVERFILKCGGERFMIHNSNAARLTGKAIASLNEDGYHYTREINGVLKTKVIIGTYSNVVNTK